MLNLSLPLIRLSLLAIHPAAAPSILFGEVGGLSGASLTSYLPGRGTITNGLTIALEIWPETPILPRLLFS